MLLVVRLGYSLLEAFLRLIHPQLNTGNEKEDVDEDSVVNTSQVRKEVFRLVDTLKSLGVPEEHKEITASSRTCGIFCFVLFCYQNIFF